MKRYPKKPYLISGYRYEQLWLIIPICIFSIFCKGVGIVGAILIFGFWFYYSVQVSEDEWRRECDKGIASIHCPKGYLESQGFIEYHGSHTEEILIPQITITKEMIDQYKKEIENKKKQLNEMIIDQHDYMELHDRWRSRSYTNDKEIEDIMIKIYHQLINKTFKYINDDAYKCFLERIEGWKEGYTEHIPYAAGLYIFFLIKEIESIKGRLYREIMKSYGDDFAILSNDAYERIMRGEDIYENYNYK